MQLKRLTLTQFRVFEQAEFEFHPGINLLVGINGAGKSTVLDALRIMLSQSLPAFTRANRRSAIALESTDITMERGALTAMLHFEAADIAFEQLIHKPREDYVVDESRSGQVRDQTYDLIERNDLTPSEKELPKNIKRSADQPFAVFFSAHRSLLDTKASSAGDQGAAFADALIADRGLRLAEFVDWWLVQETLAQENPQQGFARRLTIFKDAVTTFLDNCTNLRAVREPIKTLLIDKENTTLDLRQLSDGERSMIALVLDLARRLTQANPTSDFPLQDGRAVVLIDELDLHLHPRWQREIVDKLTRTFPNCQFIATTHSPQIVGEVSPDNIIMIEDGKAYRPDQSLGMDTNWILRHLMGIDERDAETTAELSLIEALIEDEAYDEATAAIDTLRNRVGEFPELVGLQTRIDMIAFLSEQLDDETNEQASEDEA